jgi:Flp pilus assembly protein TadB
VSALVASVLAALGVVLLLPPASPAPARRAAARPSRAATVGLGGSSGALVAGVLGGAGVAVVVGGGAGAALGLAVAVGAVAAVRWLARRDARPAPMDEADVALASDLLAAVVEAGLPVSAALAAVAAQLPGPVGDALARAARLLSVGAAPASALAGLLADAASARLGRALLAALDGGASPVPLLDAAASAQRDRARSARVQRARGIGSKAALPVGLCFLPAFVLVAIVPVVVGGASAVLTGR